MSVPDRLRDGRSSRNATWLPAELGHTCRPKHLTGNSSTGVVTEQGKVSTQPSFEIFSTQPQERRGS